MGAILKISDNGGSAANERGSLESRLRQQQKLEALSTLAGGVAHEINNPLNGIMNYAELLLDRHGSAPDVRRYAENIMSESKRVAAIVRNLLSFARQDNGECVMSQMSDIIESALSLTRAVLRKDQISLLVEVSAGLPKIKCRPQQIQQVIMNLAANAKDSLNLRYPGFDENKLIRIEATLAEKNANAYIRLTMEDHGMGIEPSIMDRIFDPFFTTKPRKEGAGLGLSVSQGIVREHHGEITVESVMNAYTRFHLDLPVESRRL